MSKVIYTRIDEELDKKLDRLIEEYNKTYPANIKLKRSLLIDFLIRGLLKEIDTPEQLREYIKKLI